ncbi:hypothetical protein OA07_27065 [Aphanizomenon flos-aquae 2012/KM1/D3]|nr:hypothetical protein OA07_27065 [Aphanizomenon flos-aquae 2012/KM1/D3]
MWDLTPADPPKYPLKSGTLRNLAPLCRGVGGISINSDTFQSLTQCVKPLTGELDSKQRQTD